MLSLDLSGGAALHLPLYALGHDVHGIELSALLIDDVLHSFAPRLYYTAIASQLLLLEGSNLGLRRLH